VLRKPREGNEWLLNNIKDVDVMHGNQADNRILTASKNNEIQQRFEMEQHVLPLQKEIDFLNSSSLQSNRENPIRERRVTKDEIKKCQSNNTSDKRIPLGEKDLNIICELFQNNVE